MTLNLYAFPDSQMLKSCYYDSSTKELTVEFNSGRIYIYVDVGLDTYNDLVNAPSAGRYFNSIKKDLKLK